MLKSNTLITNGGNSSKSEEIDVIFDTNLEDKGESCCTLQISLSAM